MYILQLLGQFFDAKVKFASRRGPKVGHVVLNRLAFVLTQQVGSRDLYATKHYFSYQHVFNQLTTNGLLIFLLFFFQFSTELMEKKYFSIFD